MMTDTGLRAAVTAIIERAIIARRPIRSNKIVAQLQAIDATLTADRIKATIRAVHVNPFDVILGRGSRDAD
jgi:hypothetical protein